MAQRARTDVGQLLLHFARETTHRSIVKPLWNIALFRFFQALNGTVLLLEVACVLDFSFDRLEFVAHGGGEKTLVGGSRIGAVFRSEKVWGQLAQNWGKSLDRHFGALE